VLDDVRECPATMTLAASWVLAFALMHLVQAQGGHAPASSTLGPWPVSAATSHLFGAQTWAEVRQGEAWRAVTATFLHGSLIHLGLNLLGLVQLGRLIEPWYGPGPFMAVCLTIGGLGNLLGGLMRQVMATIRPWAEASIVGRLWPDAINHAFGSTPGAGLTTTSVGGSTILLGLMGLILVVGWRSRTRMGTYLRDQMAILLLATALLGAFLPNYIDNYGHAGGAIVGALVGFAHRGLLRLVDSSWCRRLAWGGSAALVLACVTAQARDARSEIALDREVSLLGDRIRVDMMALPDLEKLYPFYGRVALTSGLDELDELAVRDWFGIPPTAPPPGPTPERGIDSARNDRILMKATLDRLDRLPVDLWGDVVADDFDRLRVLGRLALVEGPTFDRAYEFAFRFRSAFRALREDRERSEARFLDLLRVAQKSR
jgi:membrane associated rhomboid family serine protease